MENIREDNGLPVPLPEGFLKKMKELLGDEFEAFVQSYDRERVQGLRFNAWKGDIGQMAESMRDRFGLRPVPWCREGFYYEAESRPGRHPYHEAGVYYIQEPSAMAVVSLLDPRPGERILDLCAAPGGKTTQIAGRMKGRGLLVSNEIHPSRARILSQNIERMGVVNGVVVNEDSGRLKERFRGFFDRIVVDAPCSGEGMFRKDELARREWSEDQVALCAARQLGILENAAEMLRDGGTMVYSTCTFSPEEDEGVVEAFLARHPEFGAPDSPHTYRIWPHRAEGEGHFMALLTKAGAGDRGKIDPGDPGEGGRRPETMSGKKGKKNPGKAKTGAALKDKEAAGLLKEFLRDILREDVFREENARQNVLAEAGGDRPRTGGSLKDIGGRLLLFGEQLYLAPEEMPDLTGLRVLRPGLHLGTLKKGRFEPSHALALALHPWEVKRTLRLEAEGEEARSYLAGNTLPLREEQKGWVLVCADDYSLGWGKASGGVLKNHYPRGLRI